MSAVPDVIPQEQPQEAGLFQKPHLQLVPAAPEPEAPVESPEDPPAAPVIEQCSVGLRHYQKKAIAGILSQFKGDRENNIEPARSTLCVMATGTGKSVCIADLVRRMNNFGYGVLVMVHREELIQQLVRHCSTAGVPVAIEKAEQQARALFGMELRNGEVLRTVIASVQTLRGRRLEEWPRDSFKVIITDEAHHAVADGYRAIYRHFETARHVGFTATADRLDGANVGQVFESLAYEYNLRDAIHDPDPEGPFLVPIEAFPVETDPPIDLRNLRITAGDFNTGDLEKTINENIGTLVNAIVDTNALERRRTIAFTPDVASAEALSHALNDVGITARWVAGTSPDRKQIFEGHQSGKFQVLCNCMIATEGYDDKEISAVLICRPTKSRALYSQMAGRGTRPHPESNKQNCRLVDFAYITDKHALVSPVDLYDNSKTPDVVVSRARELVEEGATRDIDAALELALDEFNTAERVRIQRRMVQARAKTFNPLDAFDILGIRQKAGMSFDDNKRATPKMIEYGRKCGLDLPDDAGFGTTKKLLDTISVRRKYNLCTLKQAATCIRLGCDPAEARRKSFDEASAYISQHKTW